MIDDDVFDAVADRRRRLVLIQLLDYEPVALSPLSGPAKDLADANEGLIRARLNGSGASGDEDVDLLLMHAVHLPKLSEYGFVEWDREANLVTRGRRFEDVRPLLELVAGRKNAGSTAEADTARRE